MASSGNFCTLNPLTQPNAGTFSEGNLLFTHTASAWRSTLGTFGMTTGKWYWEAYQKQYIVTGNGWPVGIYDMNSGKFASNLAANYPGQATSTYGASYAASSSSHGEKHHNGSSSSLGFSSSSSGDTWQCAFDADAGKYGLEKITLGQILETLQVVLMKLMLVYQVLHGLHLLVHIIVVIVKTIHITLDKMILLQEE